MSEHPRATAAAALRRMGHAMMAHEASDDLLARVATAADRVTADFEGAPPRARDPLELKQTRTREATSDSHEVSHFDECFVSGTQNPMGIAMTVRREGDVAIASVDLGAAFEGAPGRAHGGIVAAVFDDVLGYLPQFIGKVAFTGELTVRYLAPTPIQTPLTFRASITEIDGRKIHTEAEASSNGEPVARAHAVFISIDPSRLRA